jgi:hypothetical protein
MYWLAAALLALAAAAAWFVARRRASAGPAGDWSVQPKRLLTPVEQQVFERLRAAFPQHLVFTQVSFERLLGMRRSHGSPAVFQRYQRLVADCVICSREFMPLIVVELKHAPHGSQLRTRAEASKAEALGAAGIVYVTIDVGAQPDAATLRALIRAALPRRAPATVAGSVATPVAPMVPEAASTPAPRAAAAAPASTVPSAPAAAAAAPSPVRRIARGSGATSASDAGPARPSRVA